MNKEKVYKYGFFSMIGLSLLYIFNGRVKTAIDAGAQKTKETVTSGLEKAKSFFSDQSDR